MSEQVSLRLERRVLKGQQGNARLAWGVRESVIVRLGDGPFGLGEAAPIPGHSRETVDDAHGELRSLGAQTSPGEDVLDRVQTASARFAMESALLDLQAKNLSIPLYALLAERPLASIPLAAVVSGPVANWRSESQRLWSLGYRTLKYKIGPRELEDARELLPALQREFPALRIRLDFNQTLVDEAQLHRLAGVAAEFFEEPMAPHLGSRPLGADWAIDESMATCADFRDLIASRRYRVVVLKPSVIGGLRSSLALADEARALGAKVVISYGWESEIGWAAACNLALAAGDQLSAGLAPHAGISEAQTLVRSGTLHAHKRSGLGLE